jgi:hypothetical protein
MNQEPLRPHSPRHLPAQENTAPRSSSHVDRQATLASLTSVTCQSRSVSQQSRSRIIAANVPRSSCRAPRISCARPGGSLCFPGRTKQGETDTSSGICHDGKSPAFCALHDSKSAESFVRSISLRYPCSAQALGNHPWSPAERMRSAHGRIIRCFAPHPSLLLGAALRAFFAAARRSHSGPENKFDPPFTASRPQS